MKREDQYLELTPKVAEIQTFIKQEPYVGKQHDNFKSRMINGRNEEFLAIVGRVLKSLCKCIESAFTADLPVTIDSGLKAEVVADKAVRCSLRRHLVESDVSSWDGSLCSFFRELEIDVFRAMPFEFKQLRQLIDVWRTTTIRGKNGFKARMNWGRMSGDIVTSTFNSLINLSLVLYCCEMCGDMRPEVMVKGDDNFFGTDCFDETKFSTLL